MSSICKLILVLGLALGLLGSASPASADHYSWVYNQRSGYVPMYYQPTSQTNVKAWLANNTKFVMICYSDHQWYTGNYRSNRWFYGNSWNGYYGYVHSSYVYGQKSVPRC